MKWQLEEIRNFPDSECVHVLEESLEPQTFRQEELNDLIRDLAQFKEKAELLVPRRTEDFVEEKCSKSLSLW